VVVLVGAVVALVLMGLVWTFQRHLIYLPAPTPGPTAAEAIPGARDVVLQTSDGLRLSGWWVPAGEPVRDVAVLVANGNAGNRAARAPLAHALSERGLSVLLFDYRGFGGNPGRPTEDGRAVRHEIGADVADDEVLGGALGLGLEQPVLAVGLGPLGGGGHSRRSPRAPARARGRRSEIRSVGSAATASSRRE